MTGATTLCKGGTLKMYFQAVRIPTALLLPLLLGFVTYLAIFLYLRFAAYAPLPLALFKHSKILCPL